MKHLITENLPIWTSAPNGIKKLRGLILELAVRGLLVPQDPNDEPASELLKKVAEEKARLISEGKIKPPKPLPKISEGEKPFVLPMGWEWARLGEISQVNPRNEVDDELDVSFVPMTLISTSHKGEHGQEKRRWSEVKKSFTHFAENDIGVAKITPCFENSKAAVFSGLFNGYGAGTTELHIVRPFNKTLISRYVLIYFKAPQFLLIGETKMTGTAGQKRLSKEFVANNPFPLPPLAEQHRIVAKVDELMQLCDQLEHKQNDNQQTHRQLVSTLLSTLTEASDAQVFQVAWSQIAANFACLFTTESSIEQLKQTILQLAVMGKLVPQAPYDEPASELLKKIATEREKLITENRLKTKANPQINVKEEFLGRPLNWEYCRLGNLAKFIDYRGQTPEKVESGIPLITAKNIRYGFISRTPHEYIRESDYDLWMTRGFPKINDILFTTEAPLGNVAIVNIKEKFALAQRVICFQLHYPEIAQFLRILIMSAQFQKQLLEKATGMTATGIKASKLKELPIPLPPLAEQHRIVAKVDELMSLCEQLKSKLATAQSLQQQLAETLVQQAVA